MNNVNNCFLFVQKRLSFVTLCSAYHGVGSTYVESIDESLNDFAEALPDGMEQLCDYQGIKDFLGADSLLGEIAGIVRGEGGRIIGFTLLLLSVCLLTVLAEHLCVNRELRADMFAQAVGGVVIFTFLLPVIRQTADSLDTLSAFFGAVIPVGAAVCALGGMELTALALSQGMGLVLGVFGSVSSGILIALVAFSFILSLLSSVGSGISHTLCGRISKIFTSVLGILAFVISTVLALQNILSVSADNAGLRATKYAVANMIPMVGSTVSASLSALFSGISYAKAVIGSGSVAVMISIVLSPLITLLLYRLSFGVCIAFSDACGIRDSVKPILSLSSSFDMMISVYAILTLTYAFQTFLLMRGG